MSNSLYDSARALAAGAGLNWVSANVKAVLVDLADYTFSASHQFLTSVPPIARVSTEALTGKAILSNGACDAADTIFLAVTGDTSEAVILYIDTGVESTSNLILYLDTVSGLPVIPNGMNIKLTWDPGTNAIFRL